MSTTTHVLSNPIQAHGEELKALEIRRPTVKECRAIKSLPYKIEMDESVVLDLDVAAKYIAVCAAIPQGSVEQLDLADLNGLAWRIAGFFMTADSAASKS